MLSEGRAGLGEGGWVFCVYALVGALVLPERDIPSGSPRKVEVFSEIWRPCAEINTFAFHLDER